MGGLLERVKAPPAKSPDRSRSKQKTLVPLPSELQASPLSPSATRPVCANHFEPLPARTVTPFDHFAWPSEADPSASASGSALGLTASEFFYAPLPFDRDLVESMQSLSSQSEIHETTLPGMHMHTYLVPFSPTDGDPFARVWMDETNATSRFCSVPTMVEQRVIFLIYLMYLLFYLFGQCLDLMSNCIINT
jgi:hypothetical protein